MGDDVTARAGLAAEPAMERDGRDGKVIHPLSPGLVEQEGFAVMLHHWMSYRSSGWLGTIVLLGPQYPLGVNINAVVVDEICKVGLSAKVTAVVQLG